MAMYDTVAEAQTALAQVRTAIERVLEIGQSHANNSGGSSRQTSEADLEKLERRERQILRAIKTLQGGGYSSQRSRW